MNNPKLTFIVGFCVVVFSCNVKTEQTENATQESNADGKGVPTSTDEIPAPLKKTWTVITKTDSAFVVVTPCFIGPLGFDFNNQVGKTISFRHSQGLGDLGSTFTLEVRSVTFSNSTLTIEVDDSQLLQFDVISSNILALKNLETLTVQGRELKLDKFFYSDPSRILLVSPDTLSNFKPVSEPNCNL